VSLDDAAWREVRGEFPALARHVYLNAAAASPTPRVVRAAVDRFHAALEAEGDGPWDAWLAEREATRARVAAFVGAAPDEIAFVPNTSTGINLIVDLLADDGDVLSDTLEFPTVTLPWIHRGVRVDAVAPRADGHLDVDDLRAALEPRHATVLVSHVQFSNGCRQDLAALGQARGGRHLVVCGSQSTGAFAIDVQAGQITAFATAGHKWLCAGFGAGFAFMRRDLLARRPRVMGWFSTNDPFAFDNRHYSLLDSHARSELGCPPFGQIFALGAAVDFLAGIGRERIEARVLALNTYLTDGLDRIGVPTLSPRGAYRSAETLCVFPDPAHVVAHLAERGIHVSPKPQGIRVSTHFYNSAEDVDALVSALRDYRPA
jgi:cysteine desulfurase/selenocysteine lyase